MGENPAVEFDRKIEACVDWIAGRVDRLPHPPLGLSDAPDSHLHVILDRAGYKAISSRNLPQIEEALDGRGIHHFPRLTEPGVTRDTRIYFSQDPKTFEGLASPRALFEDEATLQQFIEKNFDLLPVFKGLEYRASQYPVDPPSGHRVDVLALDRRTGELVAIELKHGAPDTGLVHQIADYVRSLRKLAKREDRPGARGLIVTGQPDRRVLQSIRELAAGAGIRIDWALYRVDLNLEVVSTM